MVTYFEWKIQTYNRIKQIIRASNPSKDDLFFIMVFEFGVSRKMVNNYLDELLTRGFVVVTEGKLKWVD